MAASNPYASINVNSRGVGGEETRAYVGDLTFQRNFWSKSHCGAPKLSQIRSNIPRCSINLYCKLDAYLRSLGLYVGEKLWFCCTWFRKVFLVMMVYLVTVFVSVCWKCRVITCVYKLPCCSVVSFLCCPL